MSLPLPLGSGKLAKPAHQKALDKSVGIKDQGWSSVGAPCTGRPLHLHNAPPNPTPWPRRIGLDRGPPPPGFASVDTPPGEGAIRMGQRYHCHNKCYTLGAAVGVMSSGKPHQSQDLPTCSCGLVARP